MLVLEFIEVFRTLVIDPVTKPYHLFCQNSLLPIKFQFFPLQSYYLREQIQRVGEIMPSLDLKTSK